MPLVLLGNPAVPFTSLPPCSTSPCPKHHTHIQKHTQCPIMQTSAEHLLEAPVTTEDTICCAVWIIVGAVLLVLCLTFTIFLFFFFSYFNVTFWRLHCLVLRSSASDSSEVMSSSGVRPHNHGFPLPVATHFSFFPLKGYWLLSVLFLSPELKQ